MPAIIQDLQKLNVRFSRNFVKQNLVILTERTEKLTVFPDSDVFQQYQFRSCAILKECLHSSLLCKTTFVKFLFPAASDTEATTTENTMHIMYI